MVESSMDLMQKVRVRALREAGADGLARCATASEVAATEEGLGFKLHPLHRRLLLEVADGGFGPGPLGIYGVGQAGRDPEMPNCFSAWQKLGGGDPSLMPPHTVPLADLGCGCWILVDTASAAGTIRHTDSLGVFEIELGMSQFLDAWVEGRDLDGFLHDRARAPISKGINPFTREPIEIRGEGPPLGRLILASPDRG